MIKSSAKSTLVYHMTSPLGVTSGLQISMLWEELLGEVILLLNVLYCIRFKGQVHVIAGRVKIVSYSSCRTSAILKYFCPL